MVIEAVVELGAEANRKTVFERLARSRYQGLTGTISFDANGEYTGSGPELYRVVKGQFEPLGPVDDYHP